MDVGFGWVVGSPGGGVGWGVDAIVTYDPGSGTTSTVLQLLDLHGDVAGTVNPAGTGLAATYSYDEFGNPTDANTSTYGWLGGKTRAQAGVGDLTLMGVQLYDPATGRFLQTDPIPGGSANPYDYCGQDPINCYDLMGTFWGSGVLQNIFDSAWAKTRALANTANGTTAAGLAWAYAHDASCHSVSGGMTLCTNMDGGVDPNGWAFTLATSS